MRDENDRNINIIKSIKYDNDRNINIMESMRDEMMRMIETSTLWNQYENDRNINNGINER